MQVPVEWLKELVDIDVSVEELAHRLTMAGVSVERIFNPFASGKIVSAIVVETRPHPNAEKLKVCKVFDGSAYHTTITSDMNVKENCLVAIAYPGTRFADGTEVRQLRSEKCYQKWSCALFKSLVWKKNPTTFTS